MTFFFNSNDRVLAGSKLHYSQGINSALAVANRRTLLRSTLNCSKSIWIGEKVQDIEWFEYFTSGKH